MVFARILFVYLDFLSENDHLKYWEGGGGDFAAPSSSCTHYVPEVIIKFLPVDSTTISFIQMLKPMGFGFAICMRSKVKDLVIQDS